MPRQLHPQLDQADRSDPGMRAPVVRPLWRTDSRRRWRAEVGADGTLRCGKAAGSIHQVGAAVQEVPSCNGWLFWHVESKAGGLRVLDELRAEIAGG